MYKVVEFSDTTSLEEFCDQICAYPRKEPGAAVEYSTVDVVIAKNLDCASENIQLEALEVQSLFSGIFSFTQLMYQ